MTQKETSIQPEPHSEFDQDVFVKYYEPIADTFIDTRGAAKSLAKMLSPKDKIFEVGMGTGYFGGLLAQEGFQVAGIQPPDKMLSRLKAEHPQLAVLDEVYIQDYEYKEPYDAIVSHSSVFLFTKPDPEEAEKLGTNLIFQSFIQDENVTFENFEKTMRALKPEGRFFINIQPNAQESAQVTDKMTFEMEKCEYDFDQSLVEKVFGITIDGEKKIWPPDISFVLKWENFKKIMDSKGYHTTISEDGYWVIFSHGQELTKPPSNEMVLKSDQPVQIITPKL